MQPGTKKGVYIGVGVLGFVAIAWYILRRAKGSSSGGAGQPIAQLTTTYTPSGQIQTTQSIFSPSASNPNLVMVSSANSNVNAYQNSSYLQALAAEAKLSGDLQALQKQRSLAAVNPGGANMPANSKSVVTQG